MTNIYNQANSSCFKNLLTSCHNDEIDITCPIFASTLKCTASPCYISLIGYIKMELTVVDFSFRKFHWLLENNETAQGNCLTAFDYFQEMNNFFCIWIAPG